MLSSAFPRFFLHLLMLKGIDAICALSQFYSDSDISSIVYIKFTIFIIKRKKADAC